MYKLYIHVYIHSYTNLQQIYICINDTDDDSFLFNFLRLSTAEWKHGESNWMITALPNGGFTS